MGDKHGRTSLYGWELAIVILSTIGVCTSGAFFSSSTSVVISLAVWRTIMGAGIGGEYPLSAVITTEYVLKDFFAFFFRLAGFKCLAVS